MIFTLLTVASRGQIYPVEVNLQVLSPYSRQLSDYTSPSWNAVVIRLRLNDLTVNNYRCKLRLMIEGPGIALVSPTDFPYTPIILDGGPPQTLHGSDIAEYLLAASSTVPHNGTDILPEGIYRFSIEVLDYNRATVVSNRSTATIRIELNDPPILNLPLNASTVPVQAPPNILFTWTPRHIGRLNAPLNTSYVFHLVEVWPADRNPNDAIASHTPLFETTTTATQLLYGADGPSLLPGRTYAWQVQVRDDQGRQLFKNDGKSEVFVFRFGDALPIPANFRLRWAKPTTLALQWDPIDTREDVRYRIQFRPRKRNENHEWYERWTRFTERTLYHLQANSEYEMRIRSENDVQESPYSEIKLFKTLREEKTPFACQTLSPPALPEETFPQFPPSVNDTLRAGGYDILIRDILKDGSRYYGSGFAIVPWLNGAKVKVTFEKISINHRFWLTAGTIKSVWHPTSDFVIEEQTPITPGRVPELGEIDITVVAADSLITIEGAAIAAITEGTNGNFVIRTTDGKEIIVPGGKSVAVTDQLGNGYVINKDGNIAKTTSTEAMAAVSRGQKTYDIALRFSAGDGKYGFDEKRFDALAHHYQQLDDGTYIPWKALSTTSTDEILAETPGSDIDLTSIAFYRGDNQVPVEIHGNQLKAHLVGSSRIEDELIAMYKSDSLPTRVIGKLNLATYHPVKHRLEVIPVNGTLFPSGFDASATERELNRIYQQAVVTWEVTLRESIDVSLPGERFNDSDVSGLASYTDDMKRVLNAFGPLDHNTWYLFIIDKPRDPSTLGYMPRNRRAGFVFTEPHQGNTSSFIRTIAHELGHGVFNLKHTFHEHALSISATDNLMDYGDGTALFKYQWDIIHEPRSTIPLFEGGDDASLKDELITFYRDAAPLLNEPEYREWVERLRKVYEFLKTCNDEGWESYNGRGIFPYCFWRDQNVPPALRYTVADLAFMAGLIDGGYAELQGLYQLPSILTDLTKLPGKVIYAYTLAYWRCRDSKLMANLRQYEYVIEELAKADHEGGLWNWIKSQWYDYEGQKEDLEKYLTDCRDAEILRETIADLYELATNWEELKALASEVVNAFKAYWDTLTSHSNRGRYEVGSLVVPVATLFIPAGAGASSKAEKLKSVFRLILKISKENVRIIAQRVGGAMVAGRNIVNPLVRRTLNTWLRAGFRAVDEGYETIVTNADNIPVAKISNDVVYIKIPEGNGWAGQSKTMEALRIRDNIEKTRTVYRLGRMNVSRTTDAQYWSPENPFEAKSISDYARKYGIPIENLQGEDTFFEVGRIMDDVPYITREAPAFGANEGGAVEVVVVKGGVKLESFSTIKLNK